MIDARYHIYSLAAVFLALAVGIVIGTSFVKGTSPADSAHRTIRRYEGVMRKLQVEISRASQDAAAKDAISKNCQDFCSAVMPVVLKDRLAWRNVAIVQTGDYGQLTGAVKRALELAGSQVTSVTKFNRSFSFGDNANIGSILADCGVTIEPDAKEPREALLQIIAQTIYTGKRTDLLPKIEKAGVATFTGDYYRINRLVVLVGGSATDAGNSADDLDNALVAQLESSGVRVVACESTSAASSYVPAWSRIGIATVDNADSPIGQVALVCALNGENADFGLKKTADRLTPQTLEKKH